MDLNTERENLPSGYFVLVFKDFGSERCEVYDRKENLVCVVRRRDMELIPDMKDRAFSLIRSIEISDMETLRKDNENLRQQVKGLTARVSAQSEIMTRYAQKEKFPIYIYPLGTPPLLILYKNHRGEVAVRRVHPQYQFYGASEFHPEVKDSWFMQAMDLEKNEVRTFLCDDVIAQGEKNVRHYCEILNVKF